MTKVMTVVGTRPEIIRLSCVMRLLDQTVEHVLVHTGQNWDDTLNAVFFRELGLRAPDIDLGVDTSSLGATLAGVITGTERALLQHQPDAVLVLGDTNSCIAALIARRMKIPVYHMEAGNRCFDLNVPEETNRRLVDHVADFNLVYTEHARRNLLMEGLHPRRVMLTGSPMREVLERYEPLIQASTVLKTQSLAEHEYFVASLHREENVDSFERLHRALAALRAVHARWKLPIMISTHPRTRKRLEQHAPGAASEPGLIFHEPFGFPDYMRLQMSARCVLSDSGTISEEASIMGFSAVTLRDSIERPEALDTGSIIATGLDPDGVVEAVDFALRSSPASAPTDYAIPDTSRRVVAFMLSTIRRHHEWAGIRRAAPGDA
jgi:UDP-N-acetylglucosamine 2-epimerase (non-hydrolysing)